MNPKYPELIEHSIKAKKFSYSPYSNFSVGAALLTLSGKIFTGTNIECSSYSLSMCAERVAFTKAISEGEKKFKAIAISSSNSNYYVFPCGACRQFMSEFSGDLDIIIIKSKKDFVIKKLSALIPDVFNNKFQL